MFNVQTVRRGTPQIARTWAAGVRAAGGGFEGNSLVIASNLARVLQTKSYYSKIKYLLPLLGTGINAARVPLVDVIGVGAATNNNFSNGDFNQLTGLQGNGSNKRLDFLFTALALGSSSNGALGYWSLNLGSPGWVMGSHSSDLLGLYLDNSTPRVVSYWGDATNHIDTGPVGPTTSHYYVQRTSSNLTVYKSGVQFAQTAGATNINSINANINLMAIDGSSLSDGTCGLAYCTDGTLGADDIMDLHPTLSSYLMTPTGRI